ncbi:hypothetical protein DL96DRAFT_1566796 [Flagelloscypha sp. PMI_526]|nr:hypothetical protein DL96DRAFT_1566796 [Flagelloscypha sp. PMI_526]
MPAPLPDWALGSSIESKISSWVIEGSLDWYLPWKFEECLIKDQTSRSPLLPESGLLDVQNKMYMRGELRILGTKLLVKLFSLKPKCWKQYNSRIRRYQIDDPDDISCLDANDGIYVEELIIERGDYSQEDFSRLFTPLRNLRILTVRNFETYHFPLPHGPFPYLKRLDARSPLTFGVMGIDGNLCPDFNAPLFANLTHIYIEFSDQIQQFLDEDWQWSFESMTYLLFARFYLDLGKDSWKDFPQFFEKHVLLRFPHSLRVCLICDDYASPEIVTAFLALDPRIVWAFDAIDLPQDKLTWELSRIHNRVVIHTSRVTVTDISDDGWCEEMVEAIAKDQLCSI